MRLFRNLKKEFFLFLLFLIVLAFFYKSVLHGQIPFPGDLLVAHQEPYRSYSILGFEPGGMPHKAQGPDVIKQLLPWKHFTIEQLKQGQIPLWNPYNFSGNPHMANFQSGVFYPGNLIFLIFDFTNAWTIYIMLSPVLTGLFTYLFLKKRLKLDGASSALGAVSFTFSSYSVVWIQYGNIGHTFVWLPLILYFTDKLVTKVDVKNMIGISVSCVFAILAGYIQGVFYIYSAAVTYFFLKAFLQGKLNIKRTVFFILSFTSPLLLTAFQILPTVELFGNSTRGNYTLDQIQTLLNPLWYLITVIAPDFFGNPASRNFWFDGTYIERVSYFGIIPFILALYAIKTEWRRIEVKIFTLLSLIVLLLSVDLIFTKYIYSIPIPVLSTTVPTRILSIFAFSGSVLAAIGFGSLIVKKRKKEIFIILLAVLSVLIMAGVFSYIYPLLVDDGQSLKEMFRVSIKNLIFPFVNVILFSFLVFYYFSKLPGFAVSKKKLISLLTIIVISFDLYFYFNKITPFSPKEFLYPETPPITYLKENNSDYSRFWGFDAATIENNINLFERIYSTEGNDPLHIKEYTEIVESTKTGRIPKKLPRPDANLAPESGYEDITENRALEKMINLLGVKYVLRKDESITGDFSPEINIFTPNKFRLQFQEGYWQVYENLKVFPRVFITSEYQILNDKNEIVDTLYSDEFDASKVIIINKNPGFEPIEASGSARIIKYTPNEIEVETDSSTKSLLFLSDTYFPGWVAEVDGQKSEILRANYSFRAVSIPSGKNNVIIKYEPNSFRLGIIISAISLTVFVLIMFVFRYKYEK